MYPDLGYNEMDFGHRLVLLQQSPSQLNWFIRIANQNQWLASECRPRAMEITNISFKAVNHMNCASSKY